MEQTLQGIGPEPALHKPISDIIRRHSSNAVDIRRAAPAGIDLSSVSSLLDLGCGVDFMARALAGKVPASAEIIGIDAHPENRTAFVASAEAGGCRGRFICQKLHSRLDFPSQAFDGVTASYSLHFFPGIITEVARVLRPECFFVVLTHSESSFSGFLRAIGMPPQHSALRALVQNFSAENGGPRLAEHFEAVERRPYPSTLVFRAEDMDDFLALVRFKAPQLMPGPPAGPETRSDLEAEARDLLERHGRITIEKDDAIFLCRRPRRQ